MDQIVWLRVSAVLIICALLALTWSWMPIATLDPREMSAWLAPHRHAWYALPLVMIAFVLLAALPVVLLIAATGIAFGPILGPVYAMAGCLASASIGFAIGRWMGLRRVEQLGGNRIKRLNRELRRNGTLAVFFIRKIPAPFSLTNVVVGASTVGYRDFLIGTFLGMCVFVVGIAGFGYQLTRALDHPSPATILKVAVFVAIPLTAAWAINRALRTRAAA
jgi:uncharacterized membrane protein YdjX (TVP38/TMEM64 family)